LFEPAIMLLDFLLSQMPDERAQRIVPDSAIPTIRHSRVRQRGTW
jgi:hypothetical protein